MDNDLVLFWMLCLTCVSGLFASIKRVRSAGGGWIIVHAFVLLVAIAGECLNLAALLYTALGLWFLLIMLPGLLGKIYHKRFMEQDYSAARRIARVVCCLHPFDGWLQQPKILHALELAQKGETKAALKILEQFRGAKSLIGMAAMINFYRTTQDWESLLKWLGDHRDQVERSPSLLPTVLRTWAETGDVRGMIEMYERNQGQIAKIVPPSMRDQCRLVLFAFTGRREAVAQLFAGTLAGMPFPAQAFWLATADWTAGATESARQQFEKLLPTADAPMRAAVERRLSRLNIPPQLLDASAAIVIQSAMQEQVHDDRFGARRPLFSKNARATQLLIALNVAMFLAEIFFGGSTNPDTLYNLGAMAGQSVREGGWWRLFAALFLHWGPLHLVMNMFALCLLGPFLEFALGFWRYLVVYLLAGIGSMACVMVLCALIHRDQLTVGASGSIMGLVGGTGGLMLRGWLREKAIAAKRRLRAILLIVVLQTFFDSMIPQVSMTAHLSGAAIGFAAIFFLSDKSAKQKQIAT